jgi:hypothetical protein
VSVGTTLGARQIGLRGTGFNPPPPPPPPPPPTGGGSSGGNSAPSTTTTIIQQIPLAGSAGSIVAPVAPSGDNRAPRLTFQDGTAKLNGTSIKISLSSNETAIASISGNVGKRNGSRLFRLRGTSRSLKRNSITTVNLSVAQSAAASLRKALKAHSVVQIHLTIKAVDTAGNTRTLTRTFRLG